MPLLTTVFDSISTVVRRSAVALGLLVIVPEAPAQDTIRGKPTTYDLSSSVKGDELKKSSVRFRAAVSELKNAAGHAKAIVLEAKKIFEENPCRKTEADLVRANAEGLTCQFQAMAEYRLAAQAQGKAIEASLAKVAKVERALAKLAKNIDSFAGPNGKWEPALVDALKHLDWTRKQALQASRESAVKAELKLQDKLPAQEAADYKKSVAKGRKLMDSGISAPPCSTEMSTRLIDCLQAIGLIKLLVVNEKRGTGFIFSGGWSRPGEFWEAKTDSSLSSFSDRPMKPGKGWNLTNLVRKYSFPASEYEAFILLRSDIDAMALAAQDAAAREVGVELKDVEMTMGKFLTTRFGLPFNYEISSLKVGGKWFQFGGGGKPAGRKGK